ncbi:MAG: hypothetical protein PHC33_02060, partial [Candidatus Omnitrophica bacterium]|nr:hypothetical protein [Candidatus Omnitrophota bacterium]
MKKRWIIFFCAVAVIPLFTAVHLRERSKIVRAYAELFSVFQEYRHAEDGLFGALSFRFDDKSSQYASGQTVKIILKDPLGQRWIFKPCLPQRDYLKPPGFLCCTEKFNSIAIYRVYKLLGVATPRIGFVKLRINGRNMTGSLQEYVPNEGTLFVDGIRYLAPEACLYLHKMEVLDWIFLN